MIVLNMDPMKYNVWHKATYCGIREKKHFFSKEASINYEFFSWKRGGGLKNLTITHD